MFRETLIESSSQTKKRRRWPMATAFTLQVIGTALLIAIPMLTTGVIPVAARTVVFTPTTYRPQEPVRQTSGTSSPRSLCCRAAERFVSINNSGRNLITFGRPSTPNTDQNVGPDTTIGGNSGPFCPKCFEGSGPSLVVPKPPDPPKRIPVSNISEAQLTNKVVPAYPRTAQLTGIQGQVKLHAIISRDGTIQSLSLISGPPLLAQAAISAVGQWRYRPYILNGEAVEVETWITVNFTRNN